MNIRGSTSTTNISRQGTAPTGAYTMKHVKVVRSANDSHADNTPIDKMGQMNPILTNSEDFPLFWTVSVGLQTRSP